jgi:hypothetical protein
LGGGESPKVIYKLFKGLPAGPNIPQNRFLGDFTL